MDNEREQLFSELRALSRKLAGVMKLVDGKLPQAMPYKRAAFELGVGLTELKEMVKLGMIRTVAYAPGKRPKVPLTEIRRLTSLAPLPVQVDNSRPSKRKARATSSSGVMSAQELRERIKKG